MEILDTKDLSKVTVKDLHDALQPNSLLERFAAKKANGVSQNREFLELKGAKGQIEDKSRKAAVMNDQIGFKCLHYSVTESSGTVEVTVVKKHIDNDVTFGIRTAEDKAEGGVAMAKDGSEYEGIAGKVVNLPAGEKEKTFSIKIIDNNDW